MNTKEFNHGLNLLVANYHRSFEPLEVEELKELFKDRFTGEEWKNIVRQIKRTRKDFLPTEACFHEAASSLNYYQSSEFCKIRDQIANGEYDKNKQKNKISAKKLIAILEKEGFDKLAKKIKKREGLE